MKFNKLAAFSAIFLSLIKVHSDSKNNSGSLLNNKPWTTFGRIEASFKDLHSFYPNSLLVLGCSSDFSFYGGLGYYFPFEMGGRLFQAKVHYLVLNTSPEFSYSYLKKLPLTISLSTEISSFLVGVSGSVDMNKNYVLGLFVTFKPADYIDCDIIHHTRGNLDFFSAANVSKKNVKNLLKEFRYARDHYAQYAAEHIIGCATADEMIELTVQYCDKAVKSLEEYEKTGELKAIKGESALIFGAPGSGKTFNSIELFRQFMKANDLKHICTIDLSLCRFSPSGYKGDDSKDVIVEAIEEQYKKNFSPLAVQLSIILADEFDSVSSNRGGDSSLGEFKGAVQKELLKLFDGTMSLSTTKGEISFASSFRFVAGAFKDQQSSHNQHLACQVGENSSKLFEIGLSSFKNYIIKNFQGARKESLIQASEALQASLNVLGFEYNKAYKNYTDSLEDELHKKDQAQDASLVQEGERLKRLSYSSTFNEDAWLSWFDDVHKRLLKDRLLANNMKQLAEKVQLAFADFEGIARAGVKKKLLNTSGEIAFDNVQKFDSLLGSYAVQLKNLSSIFEGANERTKENPSEFKKFVSYIFRLNRYEATSSFIEYSGIGAESVRRVGAIFYYECLDGARAAAYFRKNLKSKFYSSVSDADEKSFSTYINGIVKKSIKGINSMWFSNAEKICAEQKQILEDIVVEARYDKLHSDGNGKTYVCSDGFVTCKETTYKADQEAVAARAAEEEAEKAKKEAEEAAEKIRREAEAERKRAEEEAEKVEKERQRIEGLAEHFKLSDSDLNDLLEALQNAKEALKTHKENKVQETALDKRIKNGRLLGRNVDHLLEQQKIQNAEINRVYQDTLTTLEAALQAAYEALKNKLDNIDF